MKTIKEMLFGNQSENLIKQAKEIYQIEEFNDELWLTYNGALICPTDMLYPDDDSVKALQEIRRLYVERNTTKHETRRD